MSFSVLQNIAIFLTKHYNIRIRKFFIKQDWVRTFQDCCKLFIGKVKNIKMFFDVKLYLTGMTNSVRPIKLFQQV
jgi:hypothetical protein